MESERGRFIGGLRGMFFHGGNKERTARGEMVAGINTKLKEHLVQ